MLPVAVDSLVIAVRHVLQDEEGQPRVREKVRRDAAEGALHVARASVRGEDEHVRPLLRCDIEQRLPLFGL